MSGSVTENDERYLGRSRSGKWFILAAVLTLGSVWGILFLVFSNWKSRHRELAAFGAKEVAPLVDPLAARVPPTSDPKTWKSAVEATHGMLEAATGSGTINRADMEVLRENLRQRVLKITPESAIQDLSDLWDEMQKKVGPVLSGQPSRPPFCPPRPKLLILEKPKAP